MSSSDLMTYINIFGIGSFALAAIVTILQHLRCAPKKPESLL